MSDEYLYDPRKRRGSRRKKSVYRKIKARYCKSRYDPDPMPRRHRRHYDPKSSEWLDTILVYAGSGIDSYLTTKQPGNIQFGKGISVPSASGSSTNVPYLELAGIAGSFVVPYGIKGKTGKYLTKFLTGMGANGIAKIADPPKDPEKIDNKMAGWGVI